ncbi:unnamed protein product [Rotaria sp. Silwood2]|nr:unnamed protein product [Rotaria sp. Silwood2]
MGNTNNTVKGKSKQTTAQSLNARQPVLGSVNGYNYYPNPYAPEQYFYSEDPQNYPAYPQNYPAYPQNYPAYPQNYPTRPLNRPAVSSEEYLRKEFFSQPSTNNEVVEQRSSTHHSHVHHSDSANNSPRHRHHHHHHTSNGHNHNDHHHHHHHQHRHSSSPLTENKSSNTSIVKADTTPRPLAEDPPSLQTKKTIVPVANKELITSPPVTDSISVVAQRSPTPVVVKQQPPPTIPMTVSPSLPVTVDNFEKAPILVTNHVLKASDKKSIHSYGTGSLSIVKRIQSQTSTSGGKWYEHDYDKRITPLTTE